MERSARVYVAGHRGLVGSAVVRVLAREGFTRLLVRTRAELDLADARAVDRFFSTERPEFVVLAAARVGGIRANAAYPADFGRENLLIQTHVLDAAHRHGAKKLLFLGSSCVYPRLAPQPIREDSLLGGPLEPTNEAYAIAKLAGILLCRSYDRQYGKNFVAAMPANLYGPGDDFDPETGHVLPALIRKMHEAKVAGASGVRLWGSGSPRREFLHVDDLARACLHLLEHFDWRPGGDVVVNVGSGDEISIAELAALVAEIVGFTGTIAWDPSMPDGTPRRVLDGSRMRAMGWAPRIGLREGVVETYRWFCAREAA